MDTGFEIMAIIKRKLVRKSKKKMDAYYIKYSLLHYYRYKRQYNYVCTECQDADIQIANKNSLIEIEVKISKQDLLKDKLKAKHQKFKSKKVGRFLFPKFFFYAVPKELEETAKTFIKELNPNYGLIIVKEGLFGYNLEFVVNAKKLHDREITDRDILVITKRMASELTTLYKRCRIDK